MRASLGLGFFAVVVVIGCGDGPPSIDATSDNVCSQIASVACYNMFRCCSEGEIENYLNVTDPRTEDQCQDDVVRLCERSIADVDFSIKNKHVRFDGANMNQCLEALVAPEGTCATIDTMLPWTEACMDTAWVGTVADGATCDFPYECASKDSYCSPSRVCTARPTQGQPCGTGCATGLYCGPTATCVPLLGQGGMCTSNLQCGMDLFCDTSVVPGTCQALRDPGQPCTGNPSCNSKQCLPGVCEGLAQTCYTDTQCYGHCADDNSYCTTAANCAIGMCTVTATACTVATDCGVNTCVFPVQCLPGNCVGDVVCADAHLTIDYCTDALSDLPLP